MIEFFNQHHVSIFASGSSVKDITVDQRNYIAQTSIVTTNYPVSLLYPELKSSFHLFSDTDTNKWATENMKDTRLITRQITARNTPDYPYYYTFDHTKTGLRVTFGFALYFSLKSKAEKIDIYGLDFGVDRWYDAIIGKPAKNAEGYLKALGPESDFKTQVADMIKSSNGRVKLYGLYK